MFCVVFRELYILFSLGFMLDFMFLAQMFVGQYVKIFFFYFSCYISLMLIVANIVILVVLKVPKCWSILISTSQVLVSTNINQPSVGQY